MRAPRLHLTHVSTADALALIRLAKATGLAVTCDVTPHHLALHDGWLGGDRRYAWEAASAPWAGEAATAAPYDPATRVNPPLRSPDHALALWAGLVDGTIDAIATDHAPHPETAKRVEFGDAAPGIAGLETALPLVLAGVAAGLADLATIVAALTTGPVRALDLTARGVPEPGLTVGLDGRPRGRGPGDAVDRPRRRAALPRLRHAARGPAARGPHPGHRGRRPVRLSRRELGGSREADG